MESKELHRIKKSTILSGIIVKTIIGDLVLIFFKELLENSVDVASVLDYEILFSEEMLSGEEYLFLKQFGGSFLTPLFHVKNFLEGPNLRL